MTAYQQKYAHIPPLSDAINIRLYIVKTKRSSPLFVAINDDLAERFRNIASQILKQRQSIIEYDHFAELQDDEIMYAPPNRVTDQWQDHITNHSPTTAHLPDELMQAESYLVRFDFADDMRPLFAMRYLIKNWHTKQAGHFLSFDRTHLTISANQNIFRIDQNFDFFCYDGSVYVTYKKNFETATNYRDAMLKARDEIIADLQAQEVQVFDCLDTLGTLIGNHKPNIKKLIALHQAGYYNDPNCIKKLKQLNQIRNWGLQFNHQGQLIINERTLTPVLQALNNNLLRSELTDEDFSVNSKTKI